jgi:hypothetical protein
MLLVLLVHHVVSVAHCALKYLPKAFPPVLLLILHVVLSHCSFALLVITFVACVLVRYYPCPLPCASSKAPLGS